MPGSTLSRGIHRSSFSIRSAAKLSFHLAVLRHESSIALLHSNYANVDYANTNNRRWPQRSVYATMGQEYHIFTLPMCSAQEEQQNEKICYIRVHKYVLY